MTLLRIGNRYVETEAIALLTYRPGQDPIYDENEQLRQSGRPVGVTITMLSGHLPVEFEGDEAQTILDWADSKAQGPQRRAVRMTAGADPTKPGSRAKVDADGTMAPNVDTPAEPNTKIVAGKAVPVGQVAPKHDELPGDTGDGDVQNEDGDEDDGA